MNAPSRPGEGTELLARVRGSDDAVISVAIPYRYWGLS